MLPLGDRVVRVRYSLGYDSTEDPCVKFRILLPDSEDSNGSLGDWTREIRNVMEQELLFAENWGLNSYFRYRLESEQERCERQPGPETLHLRKPEWRRDNRVMLPRAFLREKEFDAEIKRVEKLLGDRVVRIRYSLDYDSTGDPCVKLRILLPDSAAVNGRIFDAARAIENTIEVEMDFIETWGINSYYRYRLQSEQDVIKEPAWA